MKEKILKRVLAMAFMLKKKMELPKFLLGDNTDCANDIFVIHTDFPRFIINLLDDEIEWLEDMNKRGYDGRKLLDTARSLIEKHSKAPAAKAPAKKA